MLVDELDDEGSDWEPLSGTSSAGLEDLGDVTMHMR